MSILVSMDSFGDVVVDHFDEICLVLFTELERNLLETVNNETQSVFLGTVSNQTVNLLHQHLSSRSLEVGIQIVSQLLSVVSYHLNLELGHRGLHYLVYHPIDHFVRMRVQQIFQEMEIVGVVLPILASLVHLVHDGVEEVLEEPFLVHFVDVESQTFGEGGSDLLRNSEEVFHEETADDSFIAFFGQKLLA